MPRPKAKSGGSRKVTQRRVPAGVRGVEIALAEFAHEVRTPLTGIAALADLLAASDLSGSERKWATGIKDAAEHLVLLTTLVVDGIKLQAAGVVLRNETFSPDRLVRAMAASLSVRATAKQLKAGITVTRNLPAQVSGDPVRLRAALENLIDNAVKFTEHGHVRLKVSAQCATRGRVRLTFAVSDSGMGLKPAEIKRLFRPFAQANADVAQRYGGVGLGLVLVKRMAKVMGGDLKVTSVVGRGSTFNLSVVAREVAGRKPSPNAVAQRAASRPLRVLCVEDNPYGRVVLNTILTELGHTVDFAGSGEAAVTAVAERRYDVILMDLILPGLDGLGATRAIRALPGVAGSTPIVGISARTDASEESAARAAGVDRYLRKPVSPAVLAEVLAAISA